MVVNAFYHNKISAIIYLYKSITDVYILESYNKKITEESFHRCVICADLKLKGVDLPQT